MWLSIFPEISIYLAYIYILSNSYGKIAIIWMRSFESTKSYSNSIFQTKYHYYLVHSGRTKKGKYQTISTYCYGNAFSLHQPIVIRPLISILFPFHTDCHFSLSPSFVYDYFVVNNIDRARKNEFSARLN